MTKNTKPVKRSARLKKHIPHGILPFMKREPHDLHAESPVTISTFPPAFESWFDQTSEQASWLKSLAGNKEFFDQCAARKKLIQRLDAVLLHLPRPDLSFQEAIASGKLTEEAVAALYASLSALLENGSDDERLILYLPFEFLPNAAWNPTSKKLRDQATRFKAAYLSAWNHLLFVQDVRANFVDGDVLEVERRVGDLPRVVKAAHLIPKLVEIGFLTKDTVSQLRQNAEDPILQASIDDALFVLAGMEIKSNVPQTRIKTEATLSDQQKQLEERLQRIDTESYGDVTKKREAWLRQDAKRKAIESASDDMKTMILDQTIHHQEVVQHLQSETRPAICQLFIQGVRKAIESAAQTNPVQAQTLYALCEPVLIALWNKHQSEIREELAKTFYHLHGLGFVSDEQRQSLGLTIPALAGPFSENIRALKTKLEDIKRIIASIEKIELSRFVYPIVLVFGSRIKGYGTQTADMDVAIFVRPTVSPDEKKALREQLKQTFSHEKIHGDVVEFWLRKTPDGLRIRDDFEPSETAVGNSSWTHVLFGACWEGDVKTVNQLREQLLIPYFFDKGEKKHGQRVRGIHLEELERDLLQYRLMHKGYERFFPSYGGIRMPHADRIDGKSIFWDSGYRQTATRLFINNVFLPKLSLGKK